MNGVGALGTMSFNTFREVVFEFRITANARGGSA